MSGNFGELTARMQSYRESVLSADMTVCPERAVYATESYKAHLDEPMHGAAGNRPGQESDSQAPLSTAD